MVISKVNPGYKSWAYTTLYGYLGGHFNAFKNKTKQKTKKDNEPLF